MSKDRLFVGMISGTSRDGVDTALVRWRDNQPEILASVCLPYPDDVAQGLADMVDRATRPSGPDRQHLDQRLGEVFSHAVNHVLLLADVDPGRVEAIGSHGQTVWHDPDANPPESIQLGHPGRIAQQTGISTVGNFRQADLLAGGQGAPLAPLVHRELFRPSAGCRAVINLGGIANVSLLRPDGSVSGFDTGPANCLMDTWIGRCRGLAFDDGGQWAAKGQVNEVLLSAMLKDPYFRRLPPKSTGVEYFSANWLTDHLAAFDYLDNSESAEDVQATLCELTARTLADSLLQHTPEEILICGGGSHNGFLLGRLKQMIACPVQDTGGAGLDPDWVEAVLFAWLARERVDQHPQDTTTITGARQPVLLGDVFNPA